MLDIGRRWLSSLIEPKGEVSSPVHSAPETHASHHSAEALYYRVAMMRLNKQLAQIDSIDTKASSFFTIGSTILPISASLISGDHDILSDDSMARIAWAVGALFYVALVGSFVWSYRLAKWDARPELNQWKTVTVGRSEREMHRWLGDACVEAYEANLPQLSKKSALVGVALWCLAFETIALTLAVLLPLF